MAVNCVGKHTGSWSYIQGSTRNLMRMKGRQSMLGGYCPRWMLYSVDAVLGRCYTQCQFMIMACRDREGWLNFVFCNNDWVVHEKKRDGGWRWEQCGAYKPIWEMRGTTCLIRLGRPRVSGSRRRIGTRTGRIGDGKLTRTQNSLYSSFSWEFAPLFSSHSFSISTLPSPKNTNLSHPSLSLHAMIKSWHRVQHTPSTAYTKYSIHRVQQTPSTAYTEYCIILRSHVSRSQPVSQLSADLVLLNSLHSNNYELTNE